MRNPPINRMVIDLAAASGQKAVWVRIAGDVDVVGESELVSVVGRVAATRCGSVYIDLAGITFAGAALINLLFRLAVGLPGHVSMVLCRPSAMTQRMIELTSLHHVATVRANLPPDWIMPTVSTGEPAAGPTSAAA